MLRYNSANTFNMILSLFPQNRTGRCMENPETRLFYDECKFLPLPFQDKSSVSIMYTLSLSVSNNPTSKYLKPVYIWFLVCYFLRFFNIISACFPWVRNLIKNFSKAVDFTWFSPWYPSVLTIASFVWYPLIFTRVKSQVILVNESV